MPDFKFQTIAQHQADESNRFRYRGDKDPEKWVMFLSKHPLSDIGDISNFDVISNDLMTTHPGASDIETFSHWASGSVTYLLLDTTQPKVLETAQQWLDRLADYPIANDTHFSKMEYDQLQEHWDDYGRDSLIDTLVEIHELPRLRVRSAIKQNDSDLYGLKYYLFHETGFSYDANRLQEAIDRTSSADVINAILSKARPQNATKTEGSN